MSSKAEKDRAKQIQDKCQAILSQLLRDEDNKYCVDCDAKGPRWASWNLGVFLCIRCAGIHRNLGVHISKVKSVNLDTWTAEQVACLQQMGNSRARAVYEANLPDSFRRPQTDSSLEAFIRAKYEQRKYIAKEWKPPPVPKPAFEIEDEKKKPREKKSKSSKSGGLEVLLPLGNAGASNPRKSPPPEMQNSDKGGGGGGTADLLGLNESSSATAGSPEDPFGGFLSANSSSTTTAAAASVPLGANPSLVLAATDAEDASCRSKSSHSNGLGDIALGQVAVDDSHKKPLSKESILSLYGQGPPVQQQQQQSQQPSSQQQLMAAMPGGMYVGQQPNIYATPVMPLMSMAGYPAVIQGVPQSSAMPVMSGAAAANLQTVNVMGTNPFLAGPGGSFTTSSSASNFGGGGVTGSAGWFAAAAAASTNYQGQQLPFGQLQQQMASLSLGAPAFGAANSTVVPANMGWVGQQPTGQTLSTNLWQ